MIIVWTCMVGTKPSVSALGVRRSSAVKTRYMYIVIIFVHACTYWYPAIITIPFILACYNYSRMSQPFPLLAGCGKGHSRVDEVQHSASYEGGHCLHHAASCRGCGPQTSCARSALFHAVLQRDEYHVQCTCTCMYV